MDFYAAQKGYISKKDLETFNKILEVIRRLPNFTFHIPAPKERHMPIDNEVSCHLLCRALAPWVELKVHDGYFGGHYQHSWLTTKEGTSLIDAYPVAGGSPFIVAINESPWPSPWPKLYKEDIRVRTSIETNPSFDSQLEIVSSEVGKLMTA